MTDFSLFPVTASIIGITVVVSFFAFNNQDLRNKLIFYPYGMSTASQYYRFLSYGLIHADYIHLFFNLITFYSFGAFAERAIFTRPEFIILYVTALVASSIFDFLKNKDNPGYAALGASGAVSAVLFSTLILEPWNADVLLLGAIRIPNILYGVLYLTYCVVMAKRGRDNIGHSAHFWGSVYGLAYTAALKPELFQSFIQKLTHPPFLN